MSRTKLKKYSIEEIKYYLEGVCVRNQEWNYSLRNSINMLEDTHMGIEEVLQRKKEDDQRRISKS